MIEQSGEPLRWFDFLNRRLGRQVVGDMRSGRARGDDELRIDEAVISRSHGTARHTELGGEVAPGRQARTGLEPAFADGERYAIPDLAGERRAAAPVEAQEERIGHGRMVQQFMPFLVLFIGPARAHLKLDITAHQE